VLTFTSNVSAGAVEREGGRWRRCLARRDLYKACHCKNRVSELDSLPFFGPSEAVWPEPRFCGGGGWLDLWWVGGAPSGFLCTIGTFKGGVLLMNPCFVLDW